MSSTSLRIDTKASKLVVRTRASGLLGRLAHDLEIAAEELSGGASVDGDAWTAELTVPVPRLRVAGVLRGERLDTKTLLASDQAEIERRIRDDVLVGGSAVIARAEGRARGKGEVAVSIGSRSARFPLTQEVTAGDGGGSVASGRCSVSLRALGIPEVKGPLGAFRVSDTIEVIYTIVLLPEGA